MKFESNFSICLSLLLFIHLCLFAWYLGGWRGAWSEGKHSKISRGNKSQLNRPLYSALTRMGRIYSGAMVIWIAGGYRILKLSTSFFLLPVCSRWKREIWTHRLQGYYCPRPQWSWEWPGGYSQVSGCNRLTAWLSPLCWHTLWYFGSWQHAR